MRKLSAFVVAGTMAMSLAACGSSTTETTAATTAAATTAAETTSEESASAQETTAAETEAPADLSGSISMVGSTSMEKFANSLSEAFMEKYPDVTVTAEFVGSGAGVEADADELTDGTIAEDSSCLLTGSLDRLLENCAISLDTVNWIVAGPGVSFCVNCQMMYPITPRIITPTTIKIIRLLVPRFFPLDCLDKLTPPSLLVSHGFQLCEDFLFAV